MSVQKRNDLGLPGELNSDYFRANEPLAAGLFMNAGVVNFLLLKDGMAAFFVMKGFGAFGCGL